MKNHTFRITFQFFLLLLHMKYDKSYSDGYRESYKRT